MIVRSRGRSPCFSASSGVRRRAPGSLTSDSAQGSGFRASTKMNFSPRSILALTSSAVTRVTSTIVSMVLLPVRRDVVERVDARPKFGARHVGPVVLVESRGGLQALLLHVQDEALVLRVECQRAPGNREELVAHAQEPAERQDAVGNPALVQVDHVVFDFPQILAGGIDDLLILQRRCGKDSRKLRYRACHGNLLGNRVGYTAGRSSCRPSSNSSIIFLLKAGMSSGLRLVT